MMRIAFLALTLASSAQAEQLPTFSRLTCHATIMDDVKVETSDRTLTLAWEPRGNRAFFPLLRPFADRAISDNLLRAYQYAKISLTVPLEACTFSPAPIVGFSCSHEPGAAFPIVIKTKLYAYDDDATADYYHGSLDAVDLASKYVNPGRNPYLQFHVDARVAGEAEVRNLTSYKFLVYEYEIDGVPARSMCDADGAAVLP